MTNLFTNVAKEEFSFLLDRGFSLSSGDLGEVRFQSDKSVISIEWDKGSGELQVYMQLRQDMSKDKPYSLSDLLAMEGADLPEVKTPFQVAEEDQLQPFLKHLADDVNKYASKALAGDRMYYRRLSEFRSRQAQSFMKGMRLRQARAKADEAWRAHNYMRVVEQYESIRDDLTAVELKRLEIAKKEGGGNGSPRS